MASPGREPLSSTVSQTSVNREELMPVELAVDAASAPEKPSPLSPTEQFAVAHGGLTPGAFLRHDVSLHMVMCWETLVQ
jgi:hypothetical protein